MVTDEETTRGILSEADKNYLRDPEGYAANHSRAAVLDRQKSIRARTFRGIQDFSILAQDMDEETRREIIPVSRQDDRWGDLYDGLVEMIAFVHLGIGSETELKRLIADGVRRGELRRGAVENELQISVDCQLDINHTLTVDLENIADRLDAGEYDKIPPGAGIAFLRSLILAGVLDPHEVLEDYESFRSRMESRSYDDEDTEE